MATEMIESNGPQVSLSDCAATWKEYPSVLPFLPMVYVAWSDGVLTPTEIQTIRAKVDQQPWMKEGAKELLASWLDPGAPPSPGLVQSWLQAIREAAEKVLDANRRSLAELGLEMAKISNAIEFNAESMSQADNALSEVEGALGVIGQEVTLDLLFEERPEALEVAEEPTAFDIQKMIDLLDGHYKDTYRYVRTLLSDPVFAYPDAMDTGAYRKCVLEWCKELAARGLGGYAFPKEFGGGGDMGKFLASFETIAFHDLSLLVKYGVQFGLWGGSVQMLGTESHHKAYLNDIAKLDLPGCFAMTETGHGSNVRELETIARYDKEREVFVLHTPSRAAGKEYIGNAACHGKAATVFAQLEVDGQMHGVHAFVVPIRNDDGTPCEGVTIEDCGEKMGLNGVDNGRLYFDHVLVPRDQLLDRFAQVTEEGEYTSPINSPGRRFFSMLGTLVGGRVSVGAASNSVAKSGLAIAIKYAVKRRQFGPPGQPEMVIMDYLTHQRRLMPLLAKTYALHFAFRHLQARYLERDEETMQEVELMAAGLKSYSSWHASETLQTCRECCGGKGYLAENRFSALKADSDVFSTFEGDNTVLMQLVAKGLLSELKQQFSEMKFFGMMRFLVEKAAHVFTEHNPIKIRNTSEEHLNDASFQLDLLRHRVQDLQMSLAQRVRRRISNGKDSFQAFMECQDHAMSLANAHIEHLVAKIFQDAISACEDEALAKQLDTLRSLYVLSAVEADLGWYLENEYMQGSKARAVRKQVNRLCQDVRRQAIPLVAAFAIPDALLVAPIAVEQD